MTRINLLEQMKEFSEVLTSDLFLPVQMQEEDEEQPPDRVPTVYIPCLPELRAYAQKAPFMTHEIVTGKDKVVDDPHMGKLLCVPQKRAGGQAGPADAHGADADRPSGGGGHREAVQA